MQATAKMMMRSVFSVMQLVTVIVVSNGYVRDKRQLVYPPQSIMQLAFGVVTPAQVKGRQIATNMGLMFNIELPTNRSVWYPYRTDYRRRRSADTDQVFISLLEGALVMSGLDAKACLLKSLCQMRDLPEESDSFQHQILNTIFRSSELTKTLEPQNLTSCDLDFPTCYLTPLDLFLQMFSSSWKYSE